MGSVDRTAADCRNAGVAVEQVAVGSRPVPANTGHSRPQPGTARYSPLQPATGRRCRTARAATGSACAHTAAGPPSSTASLAVAGAAAGSARPRMLARHGMSSGECLDRVQAPRATVGVSERQVFPHLDGPLVQRCRLRSGRSTANRADRWADRLTGRPVPPRWGGAQRGGFGGCSISGLPTAASARQTPHDKRQSPGTTLLPARWLNRPARSGQTATRPPGAPPS